MHVFLPRLPSLFSSPHPDTWWQLPCTIKIFQKHLRKGVLCFFVKGQGKIWRWTTAVCVGSGGVIRAGYLHCIFNHPFVLISVMIKIFFLNWMTDSGVSQISFCSVEINPLFKMVLFSSCIFNMLTKYSCYSWQKYVLYLAKPILSDIKKDQSGYLWNN